MSVQVRSLREEEMEAWNRFRYRVAVEQLGRSTLPGVDHTEERVSDPLDASSHVLGAFHGAALIGGVRSHYCRDVAEHPLYALYGLDDVSTLERMRTSVTTHLMIDEAWRSRGVGLSLIRSMFVFNVTNGMRYDRIDVLEQNRPLFERMGYVATSSPLQRDGFGTVIPMRLDTEDTEHLRACRSPLIRKGPRAASLPMR